MKLEEQLCPMYLAVALRALGAPQVSVFTHFQVGGNKPLLFRSDTIPRGLMNDGLATIAAAYTVAELGDLLPAAPGGHPLLTLIVGDGRERWYELAWDNHTVVSTSEAEARARMLAKLLEIKAFRFEDGTETQVLKWDDGAEAA